MTGTDILQNALILLGYVDNNGNVQLTQRVLQKALPLVNLVYSDIKRMCGVEGNVWDYTLEELQKMKQEI